MGAGFRGSGFWFRAQGFGLRVEAEGLVVGCRIQNLILRRPSEVTSTLWGFRSLPSTRGCLKIPHWSNKGGRDPLVRESQ